MDLRGKLQNEQFQMADSVKTLQLKLSEEKSEFCVYVGFVFLDLHPSRQSYKIPLDYGWI